MSTSSARSKLRELFLESTLESVDQIFAQIREEYIPTERFERKMRQIFHMTRKKEKARIVHAPVSVKRWIAIALVAALLLVLAGCAWVYAEEINTFIQEFFSTHMHLTFHVNEEDPPPKTIEKEYFPSYIPEGYELVTYEKSAIDVYVVWENDENEIIFIQSVMDKANQYYDVEHSNSKTINLEGYEVLSVMNETYQAYIWENRSYVFVIRVIGYLSPEDFCKMMNSIVEKTS